MPVIVLRNNLICLETPRSSTQFCHVHVVLFHLGESWKHIQEKRFNHIMRYPSVVNNFYIPHNWRSLNSLKLQKGAAAPLSLLLLGPYLRMLSTYIISYLYVVHHSGADELQLTNSWYEMGSQVPSIRGGKSMHTYINTSITFLLWESRDANPPTGRNISIHRSALDTSWYSYQSNGRCSCW